jgi:HAD superfamily hydrolase (TIGR01484 family)
LEFCGFLSIARSVGGIDLGFERDFAFGNFRGVFGIQIGQTLLLFSGQHGSRGLFVQTFHGQFVGGFHRAGISFDNPPYRRNILARKCDASSEAFTLCFETMNLPFKLISTDFDGTIFAEFENPPIPMALQELLMDLQGKGVKWAINTGRDMSSLLEAMARARIRVQPDFLVLVEREIHVHDGVRYASLEAWNQECIRHQNALFARIREDVPRLTQWINERFSATVYEDAYSPFCLIASDNKDADVIHEYLEAYCRSIPHLTIVRNDVYARFSHAAFNKGTALAELARRLGIGPSEVLAAGDHFNDLPMLSRAHARWLVAPNNAIPSVKAAIIAQDGYVSSLPHGHGTAEAILLCLNRNNSPTTLCDRVQKPDKTV